jgi:4-amino-4-deoxy-L-arabinose transferase-like glycosyltransferase
MERNSAARNVALLVIFVWIVLHVQLLALPYYWDEAGYFIPAAYDVYTKGTLVVQSVAAEPHPPLVAVLVAMAWKVFGFTPIVARSVVLLLGAAALLGVFRIGARLSNTTVGLAAMACTALYPVFFVQSSLVHLDIAATAFGIWALAFYFERRLALSSVMFCLAVLAKETAILVPLVLAGWEMGAYFLNERKQVQSPVDWNKVFALGSSFVVLAMWFGYYFHRTGSTYGDAAFFNYNIGDTLQPLRVLTVLPIRIWHAAGYMNLIALSGLALMASMRGFLKTERVRRMHKDSRTACSIMALLVAAHILAFSVVGGAVLARYMLPVIPLVILMCVSSLSRWMKHWQFAVVGSCLAFVAALFVNPTYQYDRADNLAYRKFVIQQEEAVHFVTQHTSQNTVSTAWPMTEGFRTPYLGYAVHPVPVQAMKDFSRHSLIAARDSGADVTVLFSREPGGQAVRSDKRDPFDFLATVRRRYFQSLPDLPLAEALRVLGGRVLWSKASGDEWIAVVKLTEYDARNR